MIFAVNKVTVTKLFAVTILLIIANNSLCQIKKLTGRILDSNTQKPIYNALIIVKGTTSGTFTNYLGYFQMEVAKNYPELIISHVGYQTGVLEIPSDDLFSASLSPKKLLLNSLNLSRYPQNIATKIIDSKEVNKNRSIEENASYKPNWGRFYNELGNSIVSHHSFLDKPFSITVHFTIDKSSEVRNIKFVPDSSINTNSITHALESLPNWKAAVQNNMQTSQEFIMDINYKESSDKWQIVDEPSTPVGGYAKFYDYVIKTMKYPAQARRMGIEGKVYVQFIVNQDGSLSNAKILKGIGAGCDEEVVRIINNAPNWLPPKANGSFVKQRVIVPITFSLGTSKDFPDLYDSDSLALELTEINVTAIGVERTRRKLGSYKPPSNSKRASYRGGWKKLNRYIKKNIIQINAPIPPNKLSNNVSVKMIIDKNGFIKKAEVVKSLEPVFDNEAIRLCSGMQKWEPAMFKNNPVADTVVVKIDFGGISEGKIVAAQNKLKEGIQFAKDEKFERAYQHFTKAIEKNPTNLNYYYNRAAVLIRLKRKDQACADLLLIKDRDQESLELFKAYCTK